jgi:hypothetical protein
VFLQKLRASNNLRNLQIYFPKENSMDRVYGMVDRVHGTSSRSLRILIKRWSSIVGWEVEINPSEGVFHILILTVDWVTDGSRQLRSMTAAAPWPPIPVRWSGGYSKLFTMRSSPVGVAWGGVHQGWFLGGGGDRRVVRDGGRLDLIFGDSGGLLGGSPV